MKEDDIVGVLTFEDAVEYTIMCNPHKAANTIIRDGICVVDLTKKEERAASALLLLLCNDLTTKASFNLKHGINGSGILSTNEINRRWRRITPRVNEVKRSRNDIKINQEIDTFLIPIIAKHVLPHELYARQALITWKKMLTKQSEYKGEIKHVLRMEHVNGLVRGPGLLENQVLHIDGIELKIIVILVVMCGDEGYSVCCVKGSHNKFEDHDRNVWVPQDKVEQVVAREGQLICFAESLIYGGGKSSGYSSTRTSLYKPYRLTTKKFFTGKHANTIPTDVSFQVTFQVATAASTRAVGMASIPSWPIIEDQLAENEQDNETKKSENRKKTEEMKSKYEKHMKEVNDREFKNRLEKGFQKWISELMGAKKGGESVVTRLKSKKQFN